MKMKRTDPTVEHATHPVGGYRVGALLSITDGVAYLLGYGVYEGEHIPPADIHPILHKAGMNNPRIKLDSGKVVWGFECWWGNEQSIKDRIKSLPVEMVDIDEARAKARGDK